MVEPIWIPPEYDSAAGHYRNFWDSEWPDIDLGTEGEEGKEDDQE